MGDQFEGSDFRALILQLESGDLRIVPSCGLESTELRSCFGGLLHLGVLLESYRLSSDA